MTKDLGGAKIYLKREDLNHTGSHKINNVLGQVLLAKKMGKTRVIAETGAGQHGVATATAAALMGMNGIILPDVPFEEKEEFAGVFREYGLDFISLIAPTSHDRITAIAKEASGFVYCVSSLGVTGVRTSITTDIGAMVDLVKAAKDIPCAVGFGISTTEQAAKMAESSDGVIVGSAIVKLCEKYGEDCVPYIKEYVRSMKDAISR